MNTISAVLIVFMGVQASRIYVTYYQANARIVRWIAWAIGTVYKILFALLINFKHIQLNIHLALRVYWLVSYVILVKKVAQYQSIKI